MKKKYWIQWIAFKFWRSKKSFSIVNIISSISFWGIAVGTAALIIVLSAFNGLEGMISTMFNNFHSELRVEPVKGKYFSNDKIDTAAISLISGIDNVSYVVEDICMVRYGDKQQVVYIKGVETNKGFEQKFKPLLLNGSSYLGNDSMPQAIVGAGIFYSLGININDFTTPLTFYSPKRKTPASADISSAFNTQNAVVGGIFSVQQDFDDKYIIVPVSVARNLFEYDNISSALEISIGNEKNISAIENKLQSMLGSDFNVKNRIEQEEALYKIMKSEKLIVFLILSLILLITSFTIISTLTLEIVGKQKDLSTLFALGASVQKIRRIIISHGFIISFLGMISGFIIGYFIIILQQHFGLVRFSSGSTFISDIYPVKIIWSDFVYVFITVIAITAVVSRIPVRRINTQWFSFRY